MSDSKVGELNGWDEIAGYFKVSVRTAQKYEIQFQMPVHRLPGAKGRVWADRTELDAWKDGGASPWQKTPIVVSETRPRIALAPKSDLGVGPAADISSPFNGGTAGTDRVANEHQRAQPGLREQPALEVPVPSHISTRFISVVVGVTCALVALLAVARGHIWYREPVSFRVESGLLRTFDVRGHLVWEFVLPETPVADAYGVPNPGSPNPDVKGVFADLDGDGRAEMIFLYWYWSAAEHVAKTEVYCFRPNGTVAWRRPAGRSVQLLNGSTLRGPWWANVVGVLGKPRSDGGRIVVGSHHAYSWPEQVVLLTARGEQVAEYWHPGWLFKMITADVDNDGTDEVILGGVNNGFSEIGYGASMVVLDAGAFDGQGPVPKGDMRQILGLRSAQEAAVLLFPEFAQDAANPQDYCRVIQLGFNDQHLDVMVEKGLPSFPTVHYQLDRSLRVANFTPSLTLEGWFVSHSSSFSRERPSVPGLRRLKVLKNRFAAASQ